MGRKTPKILRERLIEDMKRVIDSSFNELQRSHRVRIYNKLMSVVKKCTTEDELWDGIVADYEIFTVTQFTNQYGDPFFPSPWQSEASRLLQEGKYKEFFIFACRRSGKSSWMSTVLIWFCLVKPHTIVQIYAPTDQQLFIINYINDNLTQNDFLREKVVMKPHRNNLLKRYVRFINGSEVDTWSMGRGFTGDSARGSGGNLLVVEEVGLWKRGDLDSVIKPMKREVFGDKTIFFIGTPLLTYNPDLPLEWERAQAKENTWTRSFTCWDALREGIRTPEKMIDTFSDYGIPCDIVRTNGICPKHCPDMFEDLPSDWTCPFNEVCLQNDDFVREEMIQFPKMSGALFTRKLVTDNMYDSFGFENAPGPGDRRIFIMSADSALLMDYTQILVGHLFKKVCNDGVLRPAIRIVYWRTVSPEEIHGNDPYPVVDAYKTTNNIFNPRWILADASTTGGVINALASRGDLAIPRSKWVTNCKDEDKAREIPGIVWSGEFKDIMFKNLKTQLLFGTIEMPMVQPFASKMIEELTSLEAKPIVTGRYNTITNRPGKKKDMACALAMMAWALQDNKSVPHSHHLSASYMGGKSAPIGPSTEARRRNRTDTPDSIPRKPKSTVHIGVSGGKKK